MFHVWKRWCVVVKLEYVFWYSIALFSLKNTKTNSFFAVCMRVWCRVFTVPLIALHLSLPLLPLPFDNCCHVVGRGLGKIDVIYQGGTRIISLGIELIKGNKLIIHARFFFDCLANFASWNIMPSIDSFLRILYSVDLTKWFLPAIQFRDFC